MSVIKVDQIAVVVHDLDAALDEYRELFGLVAESRELIDDAGIEEAMINIDGVYLQIIQPTRSDSVVAKHLAERGPGLHHIGFLVDSVGQSLESLRARGVEVIDESPRTTASGHEIAFVYPLTSSKVLVELVGKSAG